MTATSAILTSAQIAQLEAAYTTAVQRDQMASGAWRDVYDLLYGFLTDSSVIGDSYRTDVPVDPGTWLWLKGARHVNSGEGAFGALIRDYTASQYRLRYGATPTQAQLNAASNEIAQRFIGQWLGENIILGATQPTLSQTGFYDAGAAASGVFQVYGDPASAAGWAGTILFPNLGAPDFYRNLILNAMDTPTSQGNYTIGGAQLIAVDKGSYDAVAAAAALEEFARFNVPSSVDEWNAFIRQLVEFTAVLDLQKEANQRFWDLYGLQSSGPKPKIGNDTLGVTGVQTAINFLKDAHYAVGSKDNDVIGYSSAGNGAYATDTAYWQRIPGLIGLQPLGDVINAGRGDDQVYGTTGSDILDGGEGNNTLIYLPAAWSGVLDHLYFSFDGNGKFDSRTVVDKWGIGGIDKDIAVEFDTLTIEYNKNQIADASSASGYKEVADQSDAPRIVVDLSGSSMKDGSELKRSEVAILTGDLHKIRGANVNIDLGRSPSIGYNQDIIDASGVTHGVSIDLRDGRVKATDQSNYSFDSKIYITNANEAKGTDFDDVLIAGGGKQSNGEGFSVLYGNSGNDTLKGGGEEAHLYGGSGADSFYIGSSTTVEDAQKGDGDRTYFAGIRLTGGVKQWWMEGTTAYWAPFSTLTAAFPVIGAEFLYTASIFIDAVTMKFAQYQITQAGDLRIGIGWGLGGAAIVKNYDVDLNSGDATGGIAVFESSLGSSKNASLKQLERFVNLALQAGFGVGIPGFDPLVLDLNGDGYNLVGEDVSTAWFEFDSDGFGEHAGWVRPTDGFLVRDANSNGVIDNVTEMFGNATTSGFAQLGAYDLNSDGKVDATDAGFGSLRIWQDANQDGVTDAGELKTLTELGIVSISLATTTPAAPTAVGGNDIVREGTFTRADGSTGKIADVALALDQTDSEWLGDGTVSSEAAVLPHLSGFGEVKDLRVAMTGDVTLLAAVAAFVGNTTTDLAQLKAATADILYRWAGVDGVAATALGGNGFDERKLAFLEKYSGHELMPRDANGAVQLANLADTETLWTDQLNRLTLRLAVQGPLAASFAGIIYDAERDILVASGPTALRDVIHNFISALPTDPAAALAQWTNSAPLLGVLADGMVRFDGNVVRGEYVFSQLVAGADGVTQPLSLTQLASALGIGNISLGTSVSETLNRTGSGTAILYSGGGDDTLVGGPGQDVYVFGRTIGHAVVNDSEARESGDRIRFAFLNRSDVSMRRDGTDLLITVTATSETVRVTGQFADVVLLGADVFLTPNRGIEEIQFADGAIMEMPDIMIAVGSGTAGDDHMIGTMHSDALLGGLGNDFLEGGDDADLYVVNAGDGEDIIQDNQTTPLLRAADMVVFGDDIAPDDLVISRTGTSGADLLFTIGSSGQSLLIRNQFGYTSLGYNAALAINSRIEAFAFREYGDSWSYKDIEQKLIGQATTSGVDETRGFGGDDIFQASAGDDVLIGMDGADTYNWSKGSGNDTIDEQALYIDVEVGLGGISLITRADTVQFSSGVSLGDLVFSRNSSAPDLTITILATGEKLTVKNQFAGIQTGILGAQWFNRIEWFQLADGTRLSWQDVEAIVTTGSAGDDHLYGDIVADTMRGGAGNDTLSGGGAGDTYIFNNGDGHDVVEDANWSFLGEGFLTVDGAPDVLQFGPGITAADISLARNGSDVDLIIGTTGDAVTLKGQDTYIYTGIFGNLSANRIEEIRFADGTVWTWQELNQRIIAAATTAGNDIALGTSTDDVFAASGGDDILDGGDGNDTYAFARGSGHDIIRDHVDNILNGSTDKLVFGAGITLADLTFSRNDNDLVITINDSGDSVTIDQQFRYDAWFTWHQIETFQFADGMALTNSDVHTILLSSTSGNDTLTGFGSDDLLDGGAGDDTLIGGDGSDTYMFGTGYGHDTIQEWVGNTNLGSNDTVRFTAGVAPSDLTFSRNGNDLIIGISDSSETLTIAGHFNQAAWFNWNAVENFVFADGTVWSKAEVAIKMLAGTSGDDVMVGTIDNDYLNGGAGNDALTGGDGSDTYVFGRGYGHDTITEWVSHIFLDNEDRVVFGEGISFSDVSFSRFGDNLIISINGTDDILTVFDQFARNGYFSWTDIERFEFADGTVVTQDDLMHVPFVGTPGDDQMTGTSDSDALEGRGGDDYLAGGAGDDTYIYASGDGDDRIRDYGGAAGDSDTLKLTDLHPSNMELRRNGNDLYVGDLSTDHQIRVEYQFNSDGMEGIEKILFEDGTLWDRARILQEVTDEATGRPLIAGTSGNDDLNGTSGADILRGKAGSDYLTGGAGDDTYIYASGDGNDHIWDYNGGTIDNDLLKFVDLNPSDVQLRRESDHLYIKILTTGQEMWLEYFYHSTGEHAIERMEFADGTSWDLARINQEAWRFGTANAETIDGTSGANKIQGNGGDDYLVGWAGDDTYVYRSGDGNDRIYDYNAGASDTDTLKLVDLNSSDVELSRSGNHLYIKDLATGQEIWVDQHFHSSTQDAVERIEFADGTVWDLARILTEVAGRGTGASESIDGTSGADIFQGKGGDDYLLGWAGDDTYVYRSGDGNDHIYDYNAGASDTDTLKLVDLNPDDVELRRSGDNLYVKDLNTGQETWIEHHFHSSTQDAVERIEFADGTVWDLARIAQEASYKGTAAADSFNGTSGADLFQGNGGDDTLMGGAGNDTYVYRSGDGNDHIWDYNAGASDIDTLKLVDLHPADVELRRSGDQLYVKDLATGQEIWVEYHFHSSTQDAVERIEFADGTIWNLARILQEVGGAGTPAGERIDGTSGADIFQGKGGDDYLLGWAGDDTYVYRSGDGNDHIYDYNAGASDTDTLKLVDLNPDDVQLRRSGDHLYVKDLATGQEIWVDQHFHSSTQGAVERIEFADGTVWDLARIAQEAWYRGTASGETIDGTPGADTIVGGGGNDTLRGSQGNDVYVYASGDGSDVVYDYNAGVTDLDVLKFTDLNPNDLIFRRSGDHLYIKDKITGQEIQGLYQFHSSNQDMVESVQFADGTIWNAARIQQEAWYRGTAAAETIDGTAGADTIVGGGGNDTLRGSQGNDVYVYASGDGSDVVYDYNAGVTDLDVLKFTDLNPDDLIFRRSGDHLYIKDKITGQEIQGLYQFHSSNQDMVESVQFADGTIWNAARIQQEAWFRGTAAAETIDGTAGADTIMGGGGNDTLRGSQGNDVYIYASGDGNDHIWDYNAGTADSDTLKLVDLNPDDVELRRSGDHLYVKDLTTGQEIWVEYHFYSDGRDVLEQIQFADGTVWTKDFIAQLLNQPPAIAADAVIAGAVTEQTATTGSIGFDNSSGALRFTDGTTGATHNITVNSVAASGIISGLPSNATLLSLLSFGAVTEPNGTAEGVSTWTFGAQDSLFDYLSVGQTAQVVYAVTLSNNSGRSVSQNITVTITGTNDLPLIATGTSATGSITELAATAGSSANDMASGILRFSDGDTPDTHSASILSVTALGTTSGLPANATIVNWLTKGALVEQAGATAGSLPWSFSAPDSAFDYLGAGQTATLTYAVQIADNAGGTVTQSVVVTATGTNDTPLIAAGSTATGVITELANTTGSTANDVASGTLRFTDLDLVDAHSASVLSVSASGTTNGLPANVALLAMLGLGTATEQAGVTPGSLPWTFTAQDKTFDYLGAGQSTTLTYVVQLSDGKGGTLPQDVAVTITGTNDMPQVSAGTTTGAITELASVTGSSTNDTASGTLKFTDADPTDTHSATILSVAANGTTSGLPANATMLGWFSKGTLVEQSGATPGSLPWSFAAPDSAFDYLGAGQTAALTYVVRTTDSQGANLDQSVVVTITGSNDAPTAQAKSGFTTDNWTALTIAGSTLAAGATDADTSDTLTLSSVQSPVGGMVALNAGNAVFTPTATAIGPASFTYTISDGHGGTSTATVSLTTTLYQINGTSGNDTLSGGTKPAQINGGAGNDTITAGSAGDILIGGAGTDTLTGGAGVDTVDYSANSVAQTINLSLTSSQTISSGDVDTITNVENVVGGLGGDTITGSSGNNVLTGNAGNDTISGGSGNDTLLGGDGDDMLTGGAGNDVIDGGNGIDTVSYSANSVAQTINLTLTAAQTISSGDIDTITNVENVIGGSGADTVTGTIGNNILNGGSGNDTLNGNDGDDTLIGGAGNDVMNGGNGIDTADYSYGTAAQTINLTLTTQQTISNSDKDTLSNIENVLGGTGADTITGSTDNNLLNGAAGNDNINGNDGDDTLIGGAGTDTLNGGNGIDTVDYSYGTVAQTINLSLTTSQTISSGDADTITNVENATGGLGNDTITGSTANNVLNGGAGDDRLTGGVGNDTIIGGVGTNDVAVFAGLQASYSLVTNAGVTTVVDNQPSTDGNDGTDTLTSVEKAEFKGGVQVGLAAPIILDLNGDGVSLIERNQSTTTFDWDGDGIGNRTGWVNASDGILVYDRNQDGVVSNSRELSFVDDKPGAKSDLDGLSAFDANRDGLFSSADAAFADFRVWKDANGNGQSDQGELMTLADAGVASITLAGEAVNKRWGWDENLVINTGNFTRTDGSTAALGDVALNYATGKTPGSVGPDSGRGVARHGSLRAGQRLAEAIAAFDVHGGTDDIVLHDMLQSKESWFAAGLREAP